MKIIKKLTKPELVAYADFKEAQKINPGYWKESRWAYTSQVIDKIKTIPRSINSVLEVGCASMPLCKTSTVMDLRKSFLSTLRNPWVRHDATDTPWPFEDKQFDLFVALQVWEHLGGKQEQAFSEVMRISKGAILSFPYLWRMEDESNCHHMVTKKMIKKWTCGIKPSKVIKSQKGSGPPRLIYHFEFKNK